MSSKYGVPLAILAAALLLPTWLAVPAGTVLTMYGFYLLYREGGDFREIPWGEEE